MGKRAAREIHDIKICVDWKWVRDRVSKAERIRPAATKTAPSAREALDECLRLARHLVRPRMSWAKKAVLDISPGSITLEGPVSLSGNSFSSYLKGSEHIHAFIVTIGPDLEDTATMLMENDEQLHGYLLDRIGSFAVESLAESLESGLRRIYRPSNMGLSMRLSPGYCDWPVQEQLKLDAMIGFGSAGVRLTESCMMIPRKTVSGLIGVGPKRIFNRSRSQCGICKMEDCGYRRS